MLSTSVLAQGVPTAITYQGKLTDELGRPVTDRIYEMDFVLHSSPTGTNPVWSGTGRQVGVENGLFTAKLGEINPITAGAFAGQRWLDITIEGRGLSPRTTITTAPYAFRAYTAEHVLDSTAVKSLNNLTGAVKLRAGENMSIQADGNTLILSGESIPNPLPVSQSGTWNVGVTGTPTVSQGRSNTPSGVHLWIKTGKYDGAGDTPVVFDSPVSIRACQDAATIGDNITIYVVEGENLLRSSLPCIKILDGGRLSIYSEPALAGTRRACLPEGEVRQ